MADGTLAITGTEVDSSGCKLSANLPSPIYTKVSAKFILNLVGNWLVSRGMADGTFAITGTEVDSSGCKLSANLLF